jgi:8-oxo-dGTP pyrophosphatase MutT (NUDIX family)
MFRRFLKQKLFYITLISLINLNQFCIGEEKVLLKDPPLNFLLKAEVVAVLPFFDEEVLLLQRLPSHPQANLWCPPGGKIQFNETTEDAVIREFFEETGINIEKDCLIYLGKYYVRYPNGDFIFHLYKTYIEEKEKDVIQIRNAEHQSFCLCSLNKINELPLTPGLDECFELALGENFSVQRQ